MEGILLIDKPYGWTSFDVVNKVRNLVESQGIKISQKKRFPVGHIGTLDPMASGLLVLLLGNYTKQAASLGRLDKTYDADIILGQKSTTGDNEGDKSAVSDLRPTKEQITRVLDGFIGDSEQTPPAYSAVKVNGKRAYAIARAGGVPKLNPKPITIYSLDLIAYTYPILRFNVTVSSGTYIRSLAESIGEKLGTGAYLDKLRRTTVGAFDIKDAVKMDVINADVIKKHLKHLKND